MWQSLHFAGAHTGRHPASGAGSAGVAEMWGVILGHGGKDRKTLWPLVFILMVFLSRCLHGSSTPPTQSHKSPR